MSTDIPAHIRKIDTIIQIHEENLVRALDGVGVRFTSHFLDGVHSYGARYTIDHITVESWDEVTFFDVPRSLSVTEYPTYTEAAIALHKMILGYYERVK